MNCFLYGAIVFCCGYVGFQLSSAMKNKYQYFRDLVLLIDKLIVDIGFFQTNLVDVLQKYEFSQMLKNTINKYLEFLLSGKNSNIEETLFLKELSNDENKIVSAFFLSLGSCAVDEQKNFLLNYKSIFNSFAQKHLEEYEKKGKMFFKISVLIGLAIVVLII